MKVQSDVLSEAIESWTEDFQMMFGLTDKKAQELMGKVLLSTETLEGLQRAARRVMGREGD